MKWPAIVEKFLTKTPDKKDVILSLLLDANCVQAAVWHIGNRGKPVIIQTNIQRLEHDSWEDRETACDDAIGQLEEHVGANSLQSVVLGLPHRYLTPSSDIEQHSGLKIKTICKELMLKPVGFVPVDQALIHKLKNDEGIPPSVILLSVAKDTITLSLYKIGTFIGSHAIDVEHPIADIEKALKSFRDIEVLPSRMLIYGGEEKQIEELHRDLMQYPWPTKANFLHFPKIEILAEDEPVRAVSLAGASELAQSIGKDINEEEEVVEAEAGSSRLQFPSAHEQSTHPDTREKKSKHASEQGEEAEKEKEEVLSETPEGGEELLEASVEDSNVMMVNPEDLGFTPNTDIIEAPKSPHRANAQVLSEESDQREVQDTGVSEEKQKRKLQLNVSRMSFSRLLSIVELVKKIPFTGAVLPVSAFVFFATGVMFLLYWVYPRANVTILEIQYPIKETSMLTINPTASVADINSKIIPGKKLEHTVSGEKVIPVAGKKSVGDPSKGIVTIYNKSLSPRILKKGSVLAASALQLTLDDDVTVASASESIGSITFGKANGAITASTIGPKSNLPAGTEFTFKELSASIAIARNDQPLTGGTSREVTVVSRTDYDALVSALTTELVEKAKSDLSADVGGKEKLIDATIKTEVKEKSFVEELDQEAKELQGKLTVAVSGISYNEDDASSYMSGLVEAKVPQGYVLIGERTTLVVSDIQMKKDGTISAKALFDGIALPKIDTEIIRKTLAGKSISAAQEYLRTVAGVGGVEIGNIRSIFWKNRFPINAKNISVSLAIQE